MVGHPLFLKYAPSLRSKNRQTQKATHSFSLVHTTTQQHPTIQNVGKTIV